jgi:signal transduction histidine kinase
MASDRVLGVLALHLARGAAVAPARRRALDLLGREMGIAIENVRLYEQTDAQLQRKVTQLTCAMADVERERTRAQASERAKEEVVTMLSHDLRTPLSVILTETSEFGRACTDEGCRVSRATIRRSVRRASLMVGDLLDSARLESGAVTLGKEPLELVGLARDLVMYGFPAADRERLRLVAEAEPLTVNGDRPWLERAVANVIGNGLKFARPDTAVTVRVGPRGRAVVIEVEDAGPGIPDADLPLLFRRFYRASNAGQCDGAGLGLHIARLVAEAHGGKVEARSKVGEGTTVSFTFPLATASPAA